MLEQERLIERVRAKCIDVSGPEAALMYGSFTQDLADRWSDVEFWLFFDEQALDDVNPEAWCREIAPTLLVVENEFGAHVAIFESLIRGEFHFVPRAAIDSIAEWPARGAPVERMLVVDRSGDLRRVLEQLPERRDTARSPEAVEQLCGRFTNWLLLGESVLRRGEYARAQSVLAEVNRYLLSMARIADGQVSRPTPSRLAEVELTAEVLRRYARTTAALESAVLDVAYQEAWHWGRELWAELAAPRSLDLPEKLFDAIDARIGAA